MNRDQLIYDYLWYIIKRLLKVGLYCLMGLETLLALLWVALLISFYFSIDHDSELNLRKEAFDTSAKIEKLSGVQLPEFDVINYKSSGYTFFGDFQDTVVVRFRSASPDSICSLLEQSQILHRTSDSTGYNYFNFEKDFAIKVAYDRNKNLGEIMLFYVLYHGE